MNQKQEKEKRGIKIKVKILEDQNKKTYIYKN